MYLSDNPAQNTPNTDGNSSSSSSGVLSLYTDLLVHVSNKLLLEKDRRTIITLLTVVKAATESVIYLLSRDGR